MINFNSSYESVKSAAVQGAKLVNNIQPGNEVQAFSVGQKVRYTNYSPVRFYNGVITEVYQENGFNYYVVGYDGKTRIFRQKDIELDYLQENKTTKRQKTAYSGKVYNYTVNSANDVITINGISYKVVEDYTFAISIQKTQIKAVNGALGLVRTLISYTSDIWENKIINNCRPLKG